MRESELPTNVDYFGQALRWAVAIAQGRIDDLQDLRGEKRIRLTGEWIRREMEGVGLGIAERERLEEAGQLYSVTSGTLSQVFAGLDIPKDARTFLQSFCRAIRFEQDSEEYNFLIGHLSKSISAMRIGDDWEAIASIEIARQENARRSNH